MHNSLFGTIFLASLLALSPAFAGIYKSVDEDGNTVYSDQPSENAERMEKREIPTVPAAIPDVSPRQRDRQQDARPGDSYDSIAIVSPEDDTAIRRNDGNITVSVAVRPGLKPGHELALYMDGSEVSRSRSPVFQLSNVDRGTHTLSAVVVGNDGNELQRSESIQFTLHRHSTRQPKAPSPPGSGDGPTPTNPPTQQPSGPSPTNPPSGQPGGVSPTNPPKPSS